MNTKLNLLRDEDWKGLTDVILFGCGRQGKKMYATLSRDFTIRALVDNAPAKQGRVVDGNTILSFDAARDLMHRYKVIVTASQYYYQVDRKSVV